MKNLNIYTWRELIKMYIDERPMPDVAFVTQTDAMKLQSMCKEENEGWITDRLPKKEDGLNGLVYDYRGEITIYYNIRVGDTWKPIPKCEPYVKAKPWSKVRWNDNHDCWTVHYPPNQCQLLLDFHDRDSKKQREAAERIGKIYEEIFEELRRWNG